MRNLTLIITLASTPLAFTQEGKERLRRKLAEASFAESFRLGNELMFDNIFQEALYVWELLLEKDMTNANLNYKAGSCLVSLNREKDALTYFEKAQYAVKKNYNPYSELERFAPPQTYYYLAKSSHRNGEIDTAIFQYGYFLDKTKKKHSLFPNAELGIAQCKIAKDQIENPKGYTIKNMGGVLNTSAPEYSPVITIDESAIFFTSKRTRIDSSNAKIFNIQNGQHYEDVYVSFRPTGGDWGDPTLLGFCTTRDNDASISVTPNGQKVFVYKDINGGDIYYSELGDTAFSALMPFPAAELNSTFWEPHITISADEDELYFVSDRPGGLGGTDIWRIRKLPNGEWSKAFNIGPPVNSEYNEDSPFLGVDKKTLYYSSNGPQSMGGFDIMVSQLNNDDTWSEPRNMGYPLNTVDDDIFYTTTADGRIGYYSSDKLNGYGDKDLYKIESEATYIKNIAILKGSIQTPDKSPIPPGIQIFVKDLTDDGSPKKYAPRQRDGVYVFALKPCHNYQIDYYAEGEYFHDEKVHVPCNASYQELRLSLLLDPVSLTASTLAELPINNKRWELEGDFEAEEVTGKKIFIYHNDSVAYEGKINKYKQFSYTALNPKFKYKMVVEGVNDCENIKANLIDSANHVLDTYVFLANCNTEPTVQVYSDVLTTPIFQYNFGYNKEKFDNNNEALSLYVKGIKQVVDSGKKISIVVDASASRVPTRKFKNNQDLAEKRQKTGKGTLTKALKQQGVDLDKITFVDGSALVQGPAYNNDAENKANIYQRYQYIRFEIQF